MKKLMDTVERINANNVNEMHEQLVIAYVCAEPETETEKLYKDIVSVTISNPALLTEQKFTEILKAVTACIPFAASDEEYLEITDMNSMIRSLRIIKHFKHEGVEVKFDEIMREIMEPEKIYKVKKLMDEVDKLLKTNIKIG